MKNIITTIAIMFISLGVKGQNRMYYNIGTNLESVLDSNGIFYVGMLDRKLLSDGKVGFVHKNKMFLDSFNKVYTDENFKTNPDTLNFVMTETELLDGKMFEGYNQFVMNMFPNRDNVIGYKYFDTHNSNTYDKILIYETVVNGGRKDIYTVAIGLKKNGYWDRIYNY